MSKIKKLIVLCLILFVAFLIFTSSVNAEGETRYFSYYDLCTNERILCVQHHQRMYGGTYKLIKTIDITGNKSTGKDSNGKELSIEDWNNAKLASILSNPRGQGDYGGSDVEYLNVQNAIWNYFKTWNSKIGIRYGVSNGFVGDSKGNYGTAIESQADNYANNYKEGSLTDRTNKEKIKITTYKENNENYLRVGPFKYEFTGVLSQIEVISNKDKNMQIKSFDKCIKTDNFRAYSKVEDIKSKDEFYISVKMPTDGSSSIKQIKIKNKTTQKHVTINFWQHVGYSEQNLLEYSYNNKEIPIDITLDYDIKLLGHLKVIKVDQNNKTVKLPGVGFYIQNKNTSKYVKYTKNNSTITYVDNRNDATEFITNAKGEITIKNLIIGDYIAYETKNPNYGYEILQDGMNKEVVVDKTAELEIPNKKTIIKLSGYVWIDNISGKQSERNHLYKDGEYDSNDILFDGVTVKLKNRDTGETVAETKTANGGAYQFVDVLVKDLDKYYIEFEYDGLIYTNVIARTDKDNGSKASEGTSVRESFNNKFALVEGKTFDTGITRDTNENETHEISYVINESERTAKINRTKGYYPITSDTDKTEYSIKEHYIPGEDEIKNINLGLYEREQPDISLVKDILNVKMSVNGYNHIYEYNKRFDKGTIEPMNGDFNVGVKYKNRFTGQYPNAGIYKSDYDYISPDGKNELEVYITYKLRLINEGNTLTVKINSVVDYFDSNYELYGIGTTLNEQTKDVNNSIPYEIKENNNGYTKLIINNNTELKKQQQSDIYVQFKLNKQAIINIVSNKENLDNVAEINSYSIFDETGKIYAGIDKDSNPGNASMIDEKTHEDDTSAAPGLLLEVIADRTMTGTVFNDMTPNELMTGHARQGSGIYEYEQDEPTVSGVKVTLTETTGSGKVYETITNENGDFEISGFIPGKYIVTYTWGDENYPVKDYKGTIWLQENVKEKQESGNQWYKTNKYTRYSDAQDNYDTRLKIDAGEDITTMDSTTPEMEITFEITDTNTTSVGNKFTPEEYVIKNIDFGIVERARQDITLEKKIKSFKATLANGQVIVDVTVNEDGSLSEETNHVVYIGPSPTTIPKNGFMKLELDSELIEGAKVDIEYEIKVINNSELDYISENYYKYGKEEGDIVTITPISVVDYLDRNWAIEISKNPEWTVKSIEEMKELLDRSVYEDEESTISDKTILYTETFNNPLKPTESKSINLTVSKLLVNSDEISLDNEAEITKINKNGGRSLSSIPGNYIPGKGKQEADDSQSETLIVTPNTGENLDFVTPIMIGVSALIILGVGVIFIKKKAI